MLGWDGTLGSGAYVSPGKGKAEARVVVDDGVPSVRQLVDGVGIGREEASIDSGRLVRVHALSAGAGGC
jgi:hypothetical protein